MPIDSGLAAQPLRDDRPEHLREAEIRPHAREVLRRHRREVDRVPDQALAQVVANAERDLDADQLLRFGRRCRDVRRRDDLREAGEALIGWRLGLEHVERRRRRRGPTRWRRPARPRRSARRGRCSRCEHPCRHRARLVGVQQVPRFDPGPGRAASENPTAPARRRAPTSGTPAASAARAEMNGSCARISMPNARARSATSRPMRPKPDDAERLSAQLGAGELLLLPHAALHRGVGGRNRSREREHQRRARARRR